MSSHSQPRGPETVSSTTNNTHYDAFKNCYVPEEPIPDHEMDDYMKRDSHSTPVSRLYEPGADDLLSPDQAFTGNETTYLSFGDNGTTASVTEYGQLMQMSAYLGPGRSSLFVVNHISVLDPYVLEYKAGRLQYKISEIVGIGIEIDLHSEWTHKLSFLHDRWPRSVYYSEGFEVVLQWTVHKGVVIQHYILRNTTDKPLTFKRTFNPDILIRDLTLMESKNSFNEDDSNGINYARRKGPNGYGFLTVHKLSQDDVDNPKETNTGKPWYAKHKKRGIQSDDPYDKIQDPEAIGVVMGIFMNGEAEKWEVFSDKKEIVILPGLPVELTVAYKLVTMTSKEIDWRSLLISANDVDVSRFLNESEAQSINNLGLDYSTRRNIEHILSVCSIPITSSAIWSSSVPKNSGIVKSSERLIALTCGDMSGHRVCNSASFFQFKFLAAIAKHLRTHPEYDASNETHQLHKLRKRIRETCQAHLHWIFKLCITDQGCFHPNYWVNGRVIPRSHTLATNSYTETAYQILKAFEYFQEFDMPEDGDREFIVDLLQGESGLSAIDWLEKLDSENKRDSYAWRHSPASDIPSFRLADHIWIWNALKSMRIILNWKEEGKKIKRSSGRAEQDRKIEQLKRRYEPGKVQKEITRRFTTENDFLKQRMIAVGRSARENRFLFHSRDTVLFHNLAGQLLNDDNEVWKNSLEAQRYQEKNQDMEWDNLLRYALAITMAKKGYSINRLKPEDLLNKAKRILSDSILRNGLFPSQIDGMTDEKMLVDSKYSLSFNFHVSFEVLYIMWDSRKLAGKPEAASPITSQDPSQQTHQRTPYLAILPESPTFEPTISGINLKLDDAQGGIAKAITTERTFSKGKIPYNNFIDTQSIVEVPEEWLYDFPTFIDYEVPKQAITFKSISEYLNSNDEIGHVIKDAFEKCREEGKESFTPLSASPYSLDFDMSRTRLFVTDAGRKGKPSAGLDYLDSFDDPEPFVFGPRRVWNRLRERRNADISKKRFIWLPHATFDSAFTCFLTAHEAEKEPLSIFFDNYANFEREFFDEAIRVHNTWTTQFHTSFLQLSNAHSGTERSSDGDILNAKVVGLPTLDNRQLVRASVGFRFLGDFMDRFWTCHLIEFYPCHEPRRSPLVEEIEPRTWRQRKVLELMLFNRILAVMNVSTKEILTKIQDKLGVETGRLSLTKLKSEKYFKTSIEWEALGQILEVMENDLDDITDTVADWETRERDRQQERPRWTKDDERKYRRPINKLLMFSRRKIREHRANQNAVRSLRTSLATTQERIRNELALRGNENIRYFTYATVFFLPLGFAASVFSMQAAPSHSVLRDMVICAVVGLVVTVAVLFSFQNILKLGEDVVESVVLKCKQGIRIQRRVEFDCESAKIRKTDENTK